jgi:hypothetical protein
MVLQLQAKAQDRGATRGYQSRRFTCLIDGVGNDVTETQAV